MDLPDYTFFIQIANFLFLIFLLNIIAYRPIRGILDRRKDEMTSDIKLAGEWKQKTEEYSKDLEESISQTRKEGMKEKGILKDQGIEQEREMLKEVYSSIEANIEKARENIRERMHQVSETLQNETESFSRELAEKILGRGI